jgi:6-phosphogluconolactonase
MKPIIRIYPSNQQLSLDLNKLVSRLSIERLSENKPFTIAYSGGSLPSILALEFLKQNPPNSTNHWKIFYADERCVLHSSTDSNHLACVNSGIAVGTCFPINQDLIHNPKECALDYENQLKSVFGNDLASFDLILLGMGPDGHTCSLFPGHQLLNSKDKWIDSLENSPKPPSSRITFTMPILNYAKNIAIVSTGASKAQVLKDIFENNADYPVARVKPAGQLTWFLDVDAASSISDDKKKLHQRL